MAVVSIDRIRKERVILKTHPGHFVIRFYRENKIEPEVLDASFAVEVNSFGVLKAHELKAGGQNIQVTEENKKEYVKYVLLISKFGIRAG